MSDSLDRKIRRMAREEDWTLPDSAVDRIGEALDGLPDAGRRGRRGRLSLRAAVALAALLVLTVSATALAAANYVQKRMEDMNHEKLREYFEDTYASVTEADNSNRHFTEEERRRMSELEGAYESQGRFPDREVRVIEDAEEYGGKGIAFLPRTSTFFFPEKEMSDEELLQIIDFRHKRDYSIQKMNEKVAAGEEVQPEPPVRGENAEMTDKAVLESGAVLDPSQELTIAYKGKLEVDGIAAGKDGLYLAGWDGSIHKMEFGSESSTPFFAPPSGETVRITGMAEGPEHCLYVSARIKEGEESRTELWQIAADGSLTRREKLSDIVGAKVGLTTRMLVDRDGYIYLRAGVEGSGGTSLLILDPKMKFVADIRQEPYSYHIAHGFGMGRDGKVYTLLYNKEKETAGIASVNAGEGKLDQVYEDVLPYDVPCFDLIAAGAESDLVVWGYDGIYTYNLGDEKAEQVVKPYEAPCEWEGSHAAALPDGRLVFEVAGDYMEVDSEGMKYAKPVPEKIVFYYVVVR